MELSSDPAGKSQRAEVPLGIPSVMWNFFQIPLEFLSGRKSRWEFPAGCGTVIKSRLEFPAGVRIRASCELKPAKGYVSDVLGITGCSVERYGTVYMTVSPGSRH